MCVCVQNSETECDTEQVESGHGFESVRKTQQKQENRDENQNEESDMFDLDRLMFRDTKEADALAKLGNTDEKRTEEDSFKAKWTRESKDGQRKGPQVTRLLRVTVSQIGFKLSCRASFVEMNADEKEGLISTPRDAQDGHHLEVDFPDVLGLELTRDFYKSDRLEEREASLFEAAKTMVLEKGLGGWLTLTF